MQRTIVLLAAAAVAVVLVPVVLVAVVLGGGDSDDVDTCGVGAVSSEQQVLILATIRTMESGNNYQAINRGDGRGDIASGAYQFITSTWNNFGGYRDAYLAPPELQDERAVLLLADALTAVAKHGLDWTYVPVYWYYPAALGRSLDFVPAAHEGNRLTLAEYRQRWLDTFERIANGEGLGADTGQLCGPTVAGGPVEAPNGVALPLANMPREAFASGHGGYGAIDIILPSGAPVYVVHGGTVTNLSTFGRNCSTAAGSCPSTCGLGVTIRDATWPDITWTYCHFSATAPLTKGQSVTAGEQIGVTGNTGRSGTPHLHLEIRVNHAAESRRCPQQLLLNIFDNPGTIIDPHALPTRGCF
jgi:hypothetical protein